MDTCEFKIEDDKVCDLEALYRLNEGVDKGKILCRGHASYMIELGYRVEYIGGN